MTSHKGSISGPCVDQPRSFYANLIIRNAKVSVDVRFVVVEESLLDYFPTYVFLCSTSRQLLCILIVAEPTY
jgi:hypothetical protein